MMNEREYAKIALQNYNTLIFDEEEFIRDMYKIVVIKKQFSRYIATGKINIQLALNNFTILINCFGTEATQMMVFYKILPAHYGLAKTFLTFLDAFTEDETTKDVNPDEYVSLELSNIRWTNRNVA